MSSVPTAKAQVRVHIRWMIRRDMPEVLAVEHASFEFPWCEEEFLRVLRQRNCIGMVAEHGERVVGFMIYELHKNRLHVLNCAVHDHFRRRGIGSQMAKKLITKLSHDRRSRVMLEVRETNLSAQLFFRTLGFRAVSVLRDYYEDTPEDAYVMQYRYAASSTAAIEERLAGLLLNADIENQQRDRDGQHPIAECLQPRRVAPLSPSSPPAAPACCHSHSSRRRSAKGDVHH